MFYKFLKALNLIKNQTTRLVVYYSQYQILDMAPILRHQVAIYLKNR